jgi:hypothetical protein
VKLRGRNTYNRRVEIGLPLHLNSVKHLLTTLFLFLGGTLVAQSWLDEVGSHKDSADFLRDHKVKSITYLFQNDTLSHRVFDPTYRMVRHRDRHVDQHWTYTDSGLESTATYNYDGHSFVRFFDAQAKVVKEVTSDGRNETTIVYRGNDKIHYQESINADGSCAYTLYNLRGAPMYLVRYDSLGGSKIAMVDEGKHKHQWTLLTDARGDTTYVEYMLDERQILRLDSLAETYLIHEGDGSNYQRSFADLKTGSSYFQMANDTMTSTLHHHATGNTQLVKSVYSPNLRENLDETRDSSGVLLAMHYGIQRRKENGEWQNLTSTTFHRHHDEKAWKIENYESRSYLTRVEYRDLDSNLTEFTAYRYYKHGKKEGLLKKTVTKGKNIKTERLRNFPFQWPRLRLGKKKLGEIEFVSDQYWRGGCIVYDQPGFEIIEHAILVDPLILSAQWENDDLIRNNDGPLVLSKDSISITSDELQQLLSKQLVYPPIAFEAGIQGRAFVRFSCSEDGIIEGFEVLKSPHPILANTLLEALERYIGYHINAEGNSAVVLKVTDQRGRTYKKLVSVDDDVVLGVNFRIY